MNTTRDLYRIFLLLLVSSLSLAETLKVYTYDSFVSEWGPGPQLEKLFETQCRCDLEFIANEDGVSVLNRLRMEGKRTQADVILGLDNLILQQALDEKLMSKHQQDLSSLTKNLNWNNDYFVPFDYGYFAWIYNSEKISKPATSFEELVNSNATLVYQDPRTSTPGFGLLAWVNQLYPENAADMWKKIAKNTETVTPGWWEAYSLFLNGGSDYVLSYTTSPVYHQILEDNHQYKAAPFDQGHVTQIEVAGVSTFSKKKALAREFLAFLISKPAQEILPVTNWMLPVIDGVELPKAFSQVIKTETITLDSKSVDQDKDKWIKEWRSSVVN